jgi:L-alanine-DL-glutamate epimerase-like enolase superfamily enzyme
MKIKSVEVYWAHSRSLRPPSPAGFIIEYSLGTNPLLHDLVEEPFPVHDGLIEIPDNAGLGITIREGFLAAHTVK